MKTYLAVVSRAVLFGSALACAAPMEAPRSVGPVPDGPLMTDATAYVAEQIVGSARPTQYRFTVISRFQNTSAAPVYLARCYPDSPQPLYSIGTADSSGVESAYDPNWACVGHDRQFEIQPGAVRVDTFRVQGPNSFDVAKQQARGMTNGAFRLSLVVARARGDGAPATPGSLGVSNAFTVRTSTDSAP